ncbi:WD40 repeat domain-containing protein [Paenibacillus sp. ACRSA]|uniref:WD40 repeat domain-containing protein n=1 Tax=Paenibacillus sp. ACRSA TaxID=2918211 RepID=UPI001EF44455|nr:WD40 repeat domain-containing protein [Paenibacillus sp. ACRSA]MCG7378697.1 WD40 repeat domain-containing protein [Paenibacillus sp. ACRSA]
MTKIYMRWGLGLLLLCLMLSGCSSRFQNETIIISAENDTSEQMQHDLSPVQVQKIYRLPEENIDRGYWWGWDTTNSIVGAFKSAGYPEQMMLKRLAFPFEQSETLSGDMPEIKINNNQMTLSPDGLHIADIRITRTAANLNLFSIKDKTTAKLDSFSLKDQKYFQNMSWSDNSQFISYLVLDAVEKNQSSLRIYDTKANSVKSYTLNDFNNGDTLLDVRVSNDGRSVLIKLLDSSQSNKTTIVLGLLSDGHFETHYKRQIADNQMTWISNDQFAFLGRDGTLYEYDQRNGELSVVLERVTAFEFSPDKRFIAYKLQDEDIVYVGKMQGRNVLYNEPVYHGILPLNMKWSPDNTRLFIQGPKIFANPKTMPNDDSTEEPAYIIEFE